MSVVSFNSAIRRAKFSVSGCTQSNSVLFSSLRRIYWCVRYLCRKQTCTATVAHYCIDDRQLLIALQQSSIDSQIFVEYRDFCLSHLHSTPSLGVLVGILPQHWYEKIEWFGYSTKGEKAWGWQNSRTWQTLFSTSILLHCVLLTLWPSGIINTARAAGPWQVGKSSLVVSGRVCWWRETDDEVFMTRSLKVTPKTTEYTVASNYTQW